MNQLHYTAQQHHLQWNIRQLHDLVLHLYQKCSPEVWKYRRNVKQCHTIKSITADNRSEFAWLADIFDGEHIYYAHPYSSWERGTNENHNRLIRCWLPKGSQNAIRKQVAFIENWINNYPKKILGCKSPLEFSVLG